MNLGWAFTKKDNDQRCLYEVNLAKKLLI